VQQVFGLRRKQMHRILRTVAHLDADAAGALLAVAGIEPARRPETLAPVEFARLLAALRAPRVVSDPDS
jgi:16S rRNA A1518/A1519 N6-dimethyltransferase RsmA/KsgA/DIM1 with predicted DNA glycosylase/AP lyase activity